MGESTNSVNSNPFTNVFHERVFYKNIKFVTLEELVVKLVFEKDRKLLKIFFKTYYSIKNWDPLRFLKLLLQLFENPLIKIEMEENSTIQQYLIVDYQNMESEVSNIRVGIINFIKDWISNFYDFAENPALIELLEDFLAQFDSNSANNFDVKIHNVLKDKIVSFKKSLGLNKNQNELPLPNIISPAFLTSKYSIDLIAQQISWFEFSLMKEINFREFFEPNNPKFTQITKYFTHFHKMRSMIISEILKDENKTQGSTVIQKAIKLAEKCLEYHNFNTPMEILSAFYSPTLTDTDKSKLWESLPAKSFESLITISNMLSSEDNYLNYRNAISSKQFFIPFLGIHISDIRFISEYNTAQGTDLISLEKLSNVFQEFNSFSAYCLVPPPFKISPEEEFLPKFLAYLSQFSEFQPKKINFSDEKPSPDDLKFRFVREQFELFYMDSLSGICEDFDFNFVDNQMRFRDWVILSTNSVSLNYDKSERIFKENEILDTSRVYILSEGKIKISINGTKLMSIKGPAVLAESTLIDSSNIFEFLAENPSFVIVIEKEFLFSLLESDPHLSLRFFNSLTAQVIDQLNSSNYQNCYQSHQNMPTISNSNFRIISKRLTNVKVYDPNSERDREVREIFSWRSDEVVIKKYDATLIGKINAQGSLFITQNHVCFYSKILLNKSKIAIQYSDIMKIKTESQKLIIKLNTNKKVLLRLKDGMEEEATGLIHGLVKQIKFTREPSPPLPKEIQWKSTSLESWQKEIKFTKEDNIHLTIADWAVIMKGAKILNLMKNDVVLNQSQRARKLFRIINGACRVVTTVNGKPFTIASIGNSEIFGEIGLVQNKGATASIVVDTDGTQIAVVEEHYLQRLFRMRPELAGRFMYYVFCVIIRRLGNRYWYESQDERRVVDIILEPLYNNFGRFAIVPCSSSKVIHSISGPSTNEAEEIESSIKTTKNYLCGRSVSTYPKRKQKNPDEEPLRDGHPICDQYKCIFLKNRIIAAVSDGCNWGDAPRNAAVAAINAFCNYLQSHHNEANNLQFVGSLVQRAFSMAHAAINQDRDSSISAGTTTLLGGIVLQLESEKDKIKGLNSYWGFVYGSIGDCKLFHWNVESGKLSDITQFNRNQSQSATDPGGRLGPHINGSEPDLRNFELGFYPCIEGDYFFLVSDGVHDNLDPSLLGFTPKDLGLEEEKWEDITSFQLLEEVKTKFRLSLLEKIIFDEGDKSNIYSFLEKIEQTNYRRLPPPIRIVENITEHCKYFCQAAVDWMQENPFKRLPKDYKLYPGKMDHTTILCFVVGRSGELKKSVMKRSKKKKDDPNRKSVSSPLL